jgi:hypothetical protein
MNFEHVGCELVNGPDGIRFDFRVEGGVRFVRMYDGVGSVWDIISKKHANRTWWHYRKLGWVPRYRLVEVTP